METYNGQDGVPALASDPTQPTYVAPFAALRSASLFSGNPYLNIGNSSLPVGAVSPPSSGLSFAREEPSFSYQMNQNTGSGGALVPEASQVFEGSQAGSDQITNHGIFRVADGDVSPVDEQNRRPSDRPTGVLTDRVTPAMEADPRETTPSVEGTELAQAEAPDQQTQNVPEKWPGVAVVLPDGSTLPNAESPTGQVMSPVADLSSVAAAGRRAGFIHHAMLMQPLTAFGAPAFMIWALRENLRQGGALDYQRQDGQFRGQFTPVSNVNVGLFAQQAGLTLEETLAIAGLYARLKSSNAQADQPYGLHPNQLKFITMGYKIGERGLFGRPATP